MQGKVKNISAEDYISSMTSSVPDFHETLGENLAYLENVKKNARIKEGR